MSAARDGWKQAEQQLSLVNERQRRVLDLIERGRTNQEITDALEISLAGAKWHVSELLGKLGLPSREELREFWAWHSARRRPLERFGAIAGGLFRTRWAAWGGAGVVAVAVVAPWLILRAGEDDDSTDQPPVGEPTALVGPASLAPSNGVGAYASTFPAAGADGRIAFLDPAGNLMMQALPGGAPQVVRKPAGIRDPRWSASGTYLAVVESGSLLVLRDGAGVVVANPDGGGEANWAWSPTEDVLAVYTTEGMFLYDARDGSRTTVRGQGAPLPEQPGGVIWSPSGDEILYSFLGRYTPAGPGDVHELRVLNVRTGKDRLLQERQIPRQSQTSPVGWGGDGEWVFYREAPVFASSVWVDGVPLWAMPAAGGEAIRLGTNLAHEGTFDSEGAVTAYVEGGGRFASEGVRRIELVADGGRTMLTAAAPGTHAQIAFAPGGQQLAYIARPAPRAAPSNVGGGAEALALLMGNKLWLQTGHAAAVQLTNDPAYRDENPVWSSDGDWIVFARVDADGHGSLWRIDADGGGLERVVEKVGFGQQGVGGTYGWIDWTGVFAWWQKR
jgi:DNA-binding CsgD family transcriptional regulator